MLSQASAHRFSLLLLDEGEYYLNDFSALYIAPSATLDVEQCVRQRQSGRLKLCSKSLIFDPEDVRKPVVRIALSRIEALGKMSRGAIKTLLERFGKPKRDVLAVRATQCAHMRVNNRHEPYRFCDHSQTHYFYLKYASCDTVLPQLQALLDVSKQSSSQQEALFEQLLEEKERTVLFDRSLIVDFREEPIAEHTCMRVTPLVHEPGRVLLTQQRLYFTPFNNVHAEPVHIIELTSVVRIVKRRYTLRHVAVEIYGKKDQCTFLTFPKAQARNEFCSVLESQPTLTSLESDDATNMTLKWQHGLVSNFDYLMYLNHMADRTVNDLTQYPVFPWVIADFTNDTLDLTKESTFRDLSKPIGALNKERLDTFRNRFKEMPDDGTRFLYGTHYSTPGYVLYYMVRSAPEYMLRLQNGKFDAPDRLFHSIEETWQGVLKNATDLKELTPEFYDLEPANGLAGAFLQNTQQLELGVRQGDGKHVNDVELPPWASSAHDFVKRCRDALECEHTSSHLHEWIDLIFGYKQRGEEAIKADNLFYHMTYENAVDIEAVSDPMQRKAVEMQIREFGQTPKQLFTAPHPRRLPTDQQRPSSVQHSGELNTMPLIDDILGELDALDSSGSGGSTHVHGNARNSVHASPLDGANNGDDENTWSSLHTLKVVGTERIHKESVTALCLSPDRNRLYTAATDTTLRVYSLAESKQIRNVSVCDMTLSDVCLVHDEGPILAGAWDNQLYVYSVDFGRVADYVVAHDDAVSCVVKVCDTDDTYASASWDTTVKQWRVRSSGIDRVPLHEYHDLDDEVRALCSDGVSGNLLFAGASDGSVAMLDLRQKECIRVIQPHVDALTRLSLSADQRQLVTVSIDGHFKVLDVGGGAEIFARDCGVPLHCMLTDHSKGVLIGGDDATLALYSLLDGSLVQDFDTLDTNKSAIKRMVAAPNIAEMLVTGSDDGTVRMWQGL